ncbi:Glycine/sarcosine/betaine reductase complex component C subunit beta [Clostridioides difficile]|nr:Glycine/sarcosine/betaine reductase complex component C subunit beta [Clostridioides difficile]
MPSLVGSEMCIRDRDMIVQNGSTCTVERATNPDSEFLKEVSNHIRSYEDVVNYLSLIHI